MSLPCFCREIFFVTKEKQKRFLIAKLFRINNVVYEFVCKLPHECEDITKMLGVHR